MECYLRRSTLGVSISPFAPGTIAGGLACARADRMRVTNSVASTTVSALSQNRSTVMLHTELRSCPLTQFMYEFRDERTFLKMCTRGVYSE